MCSLTCTLAYGRDGPRGVGWLPACRSREEGGDQECKGLVVFPMSSLTPEPYPMPTFAATLPTCATCGAFLTPDEQEVNLRVTSALIAMRWPLPIRHLCQRCVTPAAPAAPTDD